MNFCASIGPNMLPAQLEGYDVLISLKPKVTAASLEGITRLCAIGRCGVGYDNVDLDACTEHGIAVYITPGGVVRPVAESILLLVLALSHRLLNKDRKVREGRWAESTHRLGREPRDRVVGTIGMGNIADRSDSPAARARCWPFSGLRSLYFRQSARQSLGWSWFRWTNCCAHRITCW